VIGVTLINTVAVHITWRRHSYFIYSFPAE